MGAVVTVQGVLPHANVDRRHLGRWFSEAATADSRKQRCRRRGCKRTPKSFDLSKIAENLGKIRKNAAQRCMPVVPVRGAIYDTRCREL